MSVKVHFECPGCKHMGRVPVSYLGGIGACRHCECKFQIPLHLRLSCPHCQEVLRVRPQFLDQDVVCKLCRKGFRADLDRSLILSQLTLVEPPPASSAEEVDVTPVARPASPPPLEDEPAPAPVEEEPDLASLEDEPALASLEDELVLAPIEDEPGLASLEDELVLAALEDELVLAPDEDELAGPPADVPGPDQESEASGAVSDLEEEDRPDSEPLQETEDLRDCLESESRAAEAACREAEELRLQLEEASRRHEEDLEAVRARLQGQIDGLQNDRQALEAALDERTSAVEDARREADGLRLQIDESARRHREEVEAVNNHLQGQLHQFQDDRQAVEAALGERISAVEAERDRLFSDLSLRQADREQVEALRLDFETETAALRHESEALRQERDHLRQERDDTLGQLEDRASELARAADEHTFSEAALREECDALRLDLLRSSEVISQHEQRIQELTTGQDLLESLRSERDRAHRERDEALGQIEARASELARAADDRLVSETALRNERDQVRRELEDVLGRFDRERLALQHEARALQDERDQARQSRDDLADELARLGREREEAETSLLNERDQARRERDDALGRLDALGLSESALRDERDTLQIDLQRSSEAMSRHEQRIQELAAGQAALEAVASERDQAHRERDEALGQIEDRGAELVRAVEERSRSESALRAETEALRLDLKRASDLADERERRIQDLSARQTVENDRLRALEDDLGRLSAERDHERDDLLRRIDSLRGERDAALSEKEAARPVPLGQDREPEDQDAERVARIEADLGSTREALSEARRALDSLSRERDQLRAERDQAARSRAELENHYLDERFSLIQELDLARNVARDRHRHIEALTQQTRGLMSELVRAREERPGRASQASSEPVPPPPSAPVGLSAPSASAGIIQTASTETAAQTDYLDLILDQWDAPASAPARKPHPVSSPSSESAEHARERVARD